MKSNLAQTTQPAMQPSAQSDAPTPEQTKRGDRVAVGAIVFAAVRCTIQYILLPFVLPLFGLSGTIPTVISAILSIVALVVIVVNIRGLWHTSWRYRYLGLGVVMTLVIGLFLYQDGRVLFGWP